MLDLKEKYKFGSWWIKCEKQNVDKMDKFPPTGAAAVKIIKYFSKSIFDQVVWSPQSSVEQKRK